MTPPSNSARSTSPRPCFPTNAPERQLDDPHARTWTVGARVPHVPLRDNGSQISTLDAADHGFAVLADHGHELWRRAADEAGQSLGVAIAVTPIDPGSLPEPA